VSTTDPATAVPEPAVATARARPRVSMLRRLSLGRYTGVIVALIAVAIFLSITQGVFLTWANFTNIVRSNSAILVLATGATYVIISAGLDLSVASSATAAGMIIGLTLEHGWPVASTRIALLERTMLVKLAHVGNTLCVIERKIATATSATITPV
jgi:ribose transport system permease protein